MIKHRVSIVIPCYNSQNMIGKVVSDILETLKQRPNYEYEIILVNDGSRDNTWEVISELTRTYDNITAVNFSKNFGQHSALLAGYRCVTGDIILGLDDDGEHNPAEMFQLIDKLDEGHDYVCAEYKTNQSRFRSFGTRLNNWMASTFIDKPKEIDLASFYVMKRFVIDEIIRYEQPYPYVAGLLLRATNNLATVPLVRRERMEGHSGYSLLKMISLFANGFTAFSVKPLRVATVLGLISAFIGFVWGIVLIIKKLFISEYVMGYTSIIVAIVFFCGVIMLLLGMIGEYLGRMYMSINNSPQYVIREIKKSEQE